MAKSKAVTPLERQVYRAVLAYFKAWDRFCENPYRRTSALGRRWDELRDIASPKSKDSTL